MTDVELGVTGGVAGEWDADPCAAGVQKDKCIASFRAALTVAIEDMIVYDIDTTFSLTRRLSSSSGRSLLTTTGTVTYKFSIAKAVEAGSDEAATLTELQGELTAQLGTVVRITRFA